MATTHELEALKKASKSALKHAELVELAREHSPSKARELATSAGWPVRQVNATRSLAVLRRDHGPEAFAAFVATSEHARTAPAATEPARDNRSSDMTTEKIVAPEHVEHRERQRQNIARIENPAARLRLQAKHGLQADMQQTVEELFTTWQVLFLVDYRDGGVGILFDTLGTQNPSVIRMDDAHVVAEAQRHQQRIVIKFYRLSANQSQHEALYVDLQGLAATLGWDNHTGAYYLSSAVRKIISGPFGQHWRSLTALEQVCATYLDAENPLVREANLWVLRSRLREGRTFELRQTALPVKLEPAQDERRELDPIVDRLMELGMTKAEVRSEFLEIVKKCITNCRPQFMLALAGASCFERGDEERAQLLRERYLPGLWNDLVDSRGTFFIDMFRKFMGIANLYSFRGLESFLRDRLVCLLGNGQLTRTWQLLLCLGSDGLFCAEGEQIIFEQAHKHLLTLAAPAFELAYREGRYGVAAALVQQFGDKSCRQADEQVRQQISDSFQVERNELFARMPEEYKMWRNGEPDDCSEGMIAFVQAHDAIDKRYREAATLALQQRNARLANVVQLALDLDQPIRFEDPLAYYVRMDWPKN